MTTLPKQFTEWLKKPLVERWRIHKKNLKELDEFMEKQTVKCGMPYFMASLVEAMLLQEAKEKGIDLKRKEG